MPGGVSLIVQRWLCSWVDIGVATFDDPTKGLTGSPRFTYNSDYVAAHGEMVDGELALPFGDQAGVNLPGNLFSVNKGPEVAAWLRDIIPYGYARQHILQRLGYARDPGPSADVELLKHGAGSPIGAFRVKEAVGSTPIRAQAFCQDDLVRYGVGILEVIGGQPESPVWLGLGAGGDAPKILVTETSDGSLYLDGSAPETGHEQHWLVKWPRGRCNQSDIAVLKGEYAIMAALGDLNFDVPEVRWDDRGPVPALWVKRFDRYGAGYGNVESIYSVMGMIGDGAKLDHRAVLTRLMALSRQPDELLVDYLVRDAVNRAIGNVDNHGRNSAVMTGFNGVKLAPAFDLAPMVLDDSGVSWRTTWSREDLERGYEGIIESLAQDPSACKKCLKEDFEMLADLPGEARQWGLPEMAWNHPRITLNVTDWMKG